MFETSDKLATVSENDGESLHDMATLTEKLPFFLIGWQTLNDGELNISFHIIGSMEKLWAVLQHQTDTDGVIELQLCSPPNLNGTERWHLEPLASVAVSVGESSGTHFFSYKTVAGATYADEPTEACKNPVIILTRHAFSYSVIS